MALGTPENKGRGVNVLALIKGEERYIFLYDKESNETLLHQMGKYAADPELSFTWYDAAVLSQRIAKLRQDSSNEIQQKVTGVMHNRLPPA
jgi:hypothetical protein